MSNDCPTPSRFVESEAGSGMHSKDRSKRSLSGYALRAGQRRKRAARKSSRKSSRS
jgi:hypothetical protein